MNIYYKYIIYFFLGIIYYLLFIHINIDGYKSNTPENLRSILTKIENKNNEIDRGCSNYTCKNDPNTYDNYMKNVLSLSDSSQYQQRFNRCSNMTNTDYIYANPDILQCSNEICCVNNICETYKEDIRCDEGQIFLSNNNVDFNSIEEDNLNQVCCKNITNFSGISLLYNNIKLVRNAEVNGFTIKVHIYNTFLDFDKMISNNLTLLNLDIDNINDNNGLREIGVINPGLTDDDIDVNGIMRGYEYTDNFYKKFSEKLSNLDDSKLNSIFLKEEVKNYLDTPENRLEIPESIDKEKFNISESDDDKTKLKKLIKNIDKLIIDNNGLRYTPIDRFFHTSLNKSKGLHLDLHIFSELLNE